MPDGQDPLVVIKPHSAIKNSFAYHGGNGNILSQLLYGAIVRRVFHYNACTP